MNRVSSKLVACFALLLPLAACVTEPAETKIAENAEAESAGVKQFVTQIQDSFNSGDLDRAMTVFADDAIIMGNGIPDVNGIQAIRALYDDMMKQASLDVQFSTDEIRVFGDLAYERGTYRVRMMDKASGKALPEIHNRHVHIFKRQPDGNWKTWRLMVNSPEAPAPAPDSAK